MASRSDKEKPETPPDPLQVEREAWQQHKDPRVRMLGFISDAHSDEAAVLRAGAEFSRFLDWLDETEKLEAPGIEDRHTFEDLYEMANIRRVARIDDTERELAMGVNTRRGQTYALKNAGERHRGSVQRAAKAQARRRGRDAQKADQDAPSEVGEMSQAEMEAELGTAAG